MNTSAFLHHLTTQPTYNAQIAHIEHIPPRDANCAEPDKPLDKKAARILLEGLLERY